MEELTAKQSAVLQYIKDFMELEGLPPSIRNIREHFGYNSNNAVVNHLAALEKKGTIRRKDFGHNPIEVVNFKPGKRLIPILGTIAAGKPLLAREHLDEVLNLETFVPQSKNEFILRIKGDSMINAQISDGDLAVIKAQTVAENGWIVAALIDDEATLKYYYKLNNRVELRAANPAYAPIVFTEKHSRNISIIGKLVSIIRNYQ